MPLGLRQSMTTLRLRRYTDLPSLLHTLYERKITLLDPARWDDRNDSYFLECYAEIQKKKTILALCFTRAAETYHHWKVFADGSSGVCIIFDKSRLIAAAERQGITHGAVVYRKLDEINGTAPKVNILPYLKRWAFKDEREYRFIYAKSGPGPKRPSLDVPVPVNAFQRVILSPWMHANVAPQVMSAIRAAPGFSRLEVDRSSLIDNDTWKAWGDIAASDQE